MASQAEVRRWANGQGMDVPVRGPLPASVLDAYSTEYPDGDQLDAAAAADVSEPGPPPDDLAEKKPRAVKTPRGRGLAALTSRARSDGKAKKGSARKGPVRDRVPVDKLIAGGWRMLAGLARPLPATSRLLKLQAPVAGVLLEDSVRGTLVDRVLQPLARAEEGGKLLGALLGPPLIVTFMQAQPSSWPVLMPLLRESLLIWCEVAGPRMAAAVQRESDFEETYGTTVDDMIALLFAVPPGTAEERAADDEKIAEFIAAAAGKG